MQTRQMIERIVPGRLRQSVRGLTGAVFHQSSHRRLAAEPQPPNRDYEIGRWDYLNNIEEMARYAVIAGYCRYDGRVANVLDLGCGSGILRNWFGPLTNIEYVGVDISDRAIEVARRAWADPRTTFVASDIATYTPERKFDTIILNEVLYYFQRPGEILIRFGNFLEPNGSFLVSLWESDDSRRAWKRSEGLVDVKDSVRIAHSSGVSWTIRVCRPRNWPHEAIHGEGPAYASGHSKN
ncbi:class I SAM-dependent methyltransferase [Bradyrhizobium sp. USDA 4473]